VALIAVELDDEIVLGPSHVDLTAVYVGVHPRPGDAALVTELEEGVLEFRAGSVLRKCIGEGGGKRL
jgi:hypothetical protein